MATVLTVLTVAVGTLVAPSPGARMQLAAADIGMQTRVAGAEITARPAPVSLSRGGRRVPDDALSSPLRRVPTQPVLRRPHPIEKLPPGPVPGDPFTFQIGTLNILGSQHRGGGTSRAAMLAGAITGRGVDLVGMQEVQDDQLAVMQSRLPGYTVWPGQSLGNQGVRLQIAFRDDLFELVDTGSIATVFDFQMRPIPYVLLRDRATEGEFYVIDIHNSPRGQEASRDSATGAEIALVNQLRATGKTVFILGDTNEHTEFACRVMGSTGLVASTGGNAAGGCSVGVGPTKIDWILGGGNVAFSGHVVDYGSPIKAATDHAFVHATVTVTPMVQPTDQ